MPDQTTRGRPTLKLVCCPNQHWCGRGMTDKNLCLWCSWVAKTTNCSYWFGGDTGYCGDIFRTIGELYGPFDLACIPVGNYGCSAERWFHEHHHMSPEEAVQCHWDVQSRQSVGVHWGTFSLTGEPVTEPPERLTKAMGGKLLPTETFVCFHHGETRAFPMLGADRDDEPVTLSPFKSGLSGTPGGSRESLQPKRVAELRGGL